jgi:hypothetical protein
MHVKFIYILPHKTEMILPLCNLVKATFNLRILGHINVDTHKTPTVRQDGPHWSPFYVRDWQKPYSFPGVLIKLTLFRYSNFPHNYYDSRTNIRSQWPNFYNLSPWGRTVITVYIQWQSHDETAVDTGRFCTEGVRYLRPSTDLNRP